MDRDLKQVITVFAVVISFGGGYFLNQWQNRDKIELGERFAAIRAIEDELDGKLSYELPPDEKAVEEAVNAYYKLNDKYFAYNGHVRDDIEEDATENDEAAKDFYELREDICYIRYNHFEVLGSGIFSEAHEEYDSEATAYIIDLRDNTGGSTEVTSNILGNFVGKQEICTLHHYSGETDVYESKDKKIFNKPVVILVNEKSASSSEIFVAVMKQHYEDVMIIGTNTKGKGTFQTNKRISNDELIKYTAGYYTVGDWDCYHNIGIAPDIEIAMDSELIGTDKDIQLQAAIGYLNGEQID